MSKTVLFQTIQFSISTQSRPWNVGNEMALHIPQNSSITGTSPSDCLVSYPEHLGESYPSAEMQSVYSTAPVDWATLCMYAFTYREPPI